MKMKIYFFETQKDFTVSNCDITSSSSEELLSTSFRKSRNWVFKLIWRWCQIKKFASVMLFLCLKWFHYNFTRVVSMVKNFDRKCSLLSPSSMTKFVKKCEKVSNMNFLVSLSSLLLSLCHICLYTLFFVFFLYKTLFKFNNFFCFALIYNSMFYF